MEKFESVEAVLDFAIEREQEAVDFYEGLAEQADNAALEKTLTAFARVEAGHKQKLIVAKTYGAVVESRGTVVDMKVGDYLVPVQAGPNMTLQDALIIAMKREKAAMDMYTDLAAIVDDSDLNALFTKLAREEATHKLTFETSYEENFLSEN
ncbi:ferritin family protein [Pontiellaceae bacterium B12227]|nr:ferritin family protein [Pontiellaceae bacterium B12227]